MGGRRFWIVGGLVVAAMWFSAPAASNANGAPDPAFDSGCGCHGAASTAATVTLSGAPASYVALTSYPLVLRVTGAMEVPVVSQNTGGFAIKVNVGRFVAGTGSQLRNEGLGLTHTAAGNDQRSWSFGWIAPSSASEAAVFTFWGNAVNGDTTSQGDQWREGTLTVSGASSNATANTTSASPANGGTPGVSMVVGLGIIVAVAAVAVRRTE